jgi:hypothetical protein
MYQQVWRGFSEVEYSVRQSIALRGGDYLRNREALCSVLTPRMKTLQAAGCGAKLIATSEKP